jgi:hypothetical protein
VVRGPLEWSVGSSSTERSDWLRWMRKFDLPKSAFAQHEPARLGWLLTPARVRGDWIGLRAGGDPQSASSVHSFIVFVKWGSVPVGDFFWAMRKVYGG